MAVICGWCTDRRRGSSADADAELLEHAARRVSTQRRDIRGSRPLLSRRRMALERQSEKRLVSSKCPTNFSLSPASHQLNPHGDYKDTVTNKALGLQCRAGGKHVRPPRKRSATLSSESHPLLSRRPARELLQAWPREFEKFDSQELACMFDTMSAEGAAEGSQWQARRRAERAATGLIANEFGALKGRPESIALSGLIASCRCPRGGALRACPLATLCRAFGAH